MPSSLQALSSLRLDDGFDLKVIIVINDEECAAPSQ